MKDTPPTGQREYGRVSVRSDYWFPLVLFVSTRVALVTFSYMGLKLIPELYIGPDNRHEFLRPYPAFDGLCRWDCGWFLKVTRDGYINMENTVVFPLYPMVSRALSRVTGWHHLVSLLVVANAASLASYFVVYRVFRELAGAAAARSGLLLFAAYPFAFYQAAGYSEPMMILGSSSALLLASRRKHVWGGLVLGLGTMARHITIFYGLGLLVSQIMQRGLRPRRLIMNVGFLGLAIPFVFLAAWSWYLGRTLGDPFATWTERGASFGPSSFWSVREIFMNLPYAARPELFFYPLFSLIPLLGTILLFAKKSTIPLAAGAFAVMAVSYYGGGMALGRYSSVCWPAFLPLGVWLSRHAVFEGPVVGALMLLQGLFFWLFSHQYYVL